MDVEENLDLIDTMDDDDDPVKPSIFTPKIIILTVILLGSSTLSVMSFKTQEKLGFKYSLFQTFMMFVGEYLNLVIFGFLMSSEESRFNHFLVLTNEAKDNNQILHFSKMWMSITSFIDTLTTTFQFTALVLLPPSL